jgi:phosphatidylethanolamine/phosphatidyl-N-methylethanolamine N-methyltransferase
LAAGPARLPTPSSRAASPLDLDATRVAEAPLDDVGAVVSGLPLLAIPAPVQHQIVEGAFRLLRPGGVFVQFTYGWRPPIDRKVREALGLEWTVSPWVRRNVPPARVAGKHQASGAGGGYLMQSRIAA